MTLTPNMETILVAVLGEMRRLDAFADRPPPGMDRDEWRTQWRERQDYDKFGVRHNLARWLHDEPTPSNSAVFSRALRNMEAMGLVVRVSRWGGSKTTHVRLTPLGRAEAERLLADQEAALAALLKDFDLSVDGPSEAPPTAPQEADDSLDSPSPRR